MPRQKSVIQTLAISLWKLAGAWWKVDRIRIPHSRRADQNEILKHDAQCRNAAENRRHYHSLLSVNRRSDETG